MLLHFESVCACVRAATQTDVSVLSTDVGSGCFWQMLVTWCHSCCEQFVYMCLVVFPFHACSAVIDSQRDPAVGADTLCHSNCYQGDNKGEGVSPAPDARVATTTEEETSGGGFWTQEKVSLLVPLLLSDEFLEDQNVLS